MSTYAFLALNRVRDQDVLKHFGIVFSLAKAAKKTSREVLQTDVSKGYAVPYPTLWKAMDEIFEKATAKQQAQLTAEHHLSSALDNFQIGKPLKEQRGGHSARMLKGTMKFARKSHIPPPPVGSILAPFSDHTLRFCVASILDESEYVSTLVVVEQERPHS